MVINSARSVRYQRHQTNVPTLQDPQVHGGHIPQELLHGHSLHGRNPQELVASLTSALRGEEEKRHLLGRDRKNTYHHLDQRPPQCMA
jgi:hypothetical protein